MLLQDQKNVVKYMDIQTDARRNMFHREVYALSLLGSHPNIVALKGWREDILQNEQGEKYGYLEMEYAPGKTVWEWLTDHKTDPDINLRSLWYPFVQTLLLTIEYIHSNGVHHLDLHPKNVMVNITSENKNTLKVIDFGMSCSRKPEFPDNEKCGSPGMVPYYTGFVSVEKAINSRLLQPEDMRMMDLWSVGALAHLWWFGEAPYAKEWKGDYEGAGVGWLFWCAKNTAKYPPTLDRDDSDHPEAIKAMRQLLRNPLVGDKEKGWVPGETVELPRNLKTLAPPDTLWPPRGGP